MARKFIGYLSVNFQRIRIQLYKRLSSSINVKGEAHYYQPVLVKGEGILEFGSSVCFGVMNSPYFYSTYCYLEARNSSAKITIGNNVTFNNNLCIIAEKGSVTIGDDVLVGSNVEIFDSDFHELNPDLRNSNLHVSKDVIICNNVFIGNGVKILKGVTVGNNCVIAAGSVVTRSFDADCIIGGNPAVFLKKLDKLNPAPIQLPGEK